MPSVLLVCLIGVASYLVAVGLEYLPVWWERLPPLAEYSVAILLIALIVIGVLILLNPPVGEPFSTINGSLNSN